LLDGQSGFVHIVYRFTLNDRYSTGPTFRLNLATMVNDFYTSGRQPVYVNVDTVLSSGKLSVKVCHHPLHPRIYFLLKAYVLGLDPTVASEKKVVMTEIPCHIRATPEEKIAGLV